MCSLWRTSWRDAAGRLVGRDDIARDASKMRSKNSAVGAQLCDQTSSGANPVMTTTREAAYIHKHVRCYGTFPLLRSALINVFSRLEDWDHTA